MLALDLFVFGGKKAHRVPVREALAWVVALGDPGQVSCRSDVVVSGRRVGREIANRKTLEFLAGYLFEQSLSVDNMFVFVMIFGYFAVLNYSAGCCSMVCSGPSSCVPA